MPQRKRQMPTAVLIGSFRKDFKEIYNISLAFKKAGIEVLSPRLGHIINPDAEFITLTTDKLGSARAIQDEVLEKIRAADFVYLVNPSGRVGLSAAFEVGFAKSISRPVYAVARPDDSTLQHYIDEIAPASSLITRYRDQLQKGTTYHIFFDADDTLWDDQGKLQKAEQEIERLVDELLGGPSSFQEKFIARIKAIQLGDPLKKGVTQGPQISQTQFDVCRLSSNCLSN
jgi:hypothetical protein